MMTTPFIKTEVELGKKYWWCACGNSANLPFCDGSHKADQAAPRPVEYIATKTGDVFFCGCQKTNNQPLCDGSHKF